MPQIKLKFLRSPLMRTQQRLLDILCEHFEILPVSNNPDYVIGSAEGAQLHGVRRLIVDAGVFTARSEQLVCNADGIGTTQADNGYCPIAGGC
mgnify:CR=1 FL=1